MCYLLLSFSPHRPTHLRRATVLSNCFIVVGALRITRHTYTRVDWGFDKWQGSLKADAPPTRAWFAQLINCDLIIKYKFEVGNGGRGKLRYNNCGETQQSCKSLSQNSSCGCWQPDSQNLLRRKSSRSCMTLSLHVCWQLRERVKRLL
jgi:hypothetical protein